MYFRALKIARLVSDITGDSPTVNSAVVPPAHNEASPRVVWEVRTNLGVTFRPELGYIVVTTKASEEIHGGQWKVAIEAYFGLHGE